MTSRFRRSRLASSAILASCVGGTSELVVHNTALVVRSDAAFTHSADLPQRFESTVQAALTYWGGTWNDLSGTTVTLEGNQHVECNGASGAISAAMPAARFASPRAIRASAPGTASRRPSSFTSIGHAVIDDPEHEDPRWMDFEAVAQALSGRPGHDGDCKLYPSVWRHVLARR